MMRRLDKYLKAFKTKNPQFDSVELVKTWQGNYELICRYPYGLYKRPYFKKLNAPNSNVIITKHYKINILQFLIASLFLKSSV